MILYQLAKMLEERESLNKTIKESVGDVSLLVNQKQQVENQMIMEANRYFEQDQYL